MSRGIFKISQIHENISMPIRLLILVTVSLHPLPVIRKSGIILIKHLMHLLTILGSVASIVGLVLAVMFRLSDRNNSSYSSSNLFLSHQMDSLVVMAGSRDYRTVLRKYRGFGELLP